VEHSLYVHPQFQGQGLGKDMLIRLIEAAHKDGRHTMIGGIDSTNSVSLKLHADLGFKEVGRLPEVAYKFDKWLDLIFMQLIL
jgi:phosphinothricin acetyltransferase